MENEQKLIDTEYFVEANSYEKLHLWKDYNEKYEWIQDSSGFGLEIGSIGSNMPVFVSFHFAKVNNTNVCFYQATSRYVDHTMVENWIRKYCNKITDANNFHNVCYTPSELRQKKLDTI